MAKQSMIQREEKRNRLSLKYNLKRESLKEQLKLTSDYQSKSLRRLDFEINY